MKELSTFVKDEFLKKKLFEEGIYVEDFNHADELANAVNYGKLFNIVFQNSNLKERFLDTLSTQRPEMTVINCNSSIDRFFENDFTGLLIFDNIKKCKDTEILEEIKKYKAVLIC